MQKSKAKEVLRQAGLRATVPRVALLQLMDGASKPMTHTEVVESLGQEDWDQATLYRNLIRFEDEGIIRIASQLGGQARYELAQGSKKEDHVHPHFVCKDCGQIECLPSMNINLGEQATWQKAVDEATIEIVGKCPDCR